MYIKKVFYSLNFYPDFFLLFAFPLPEHTYFRISSLVSTFVFFNLSLIFFIFQDEVLAITEKVVIRLEDLLTWITEASDWNWGLGTVWQRECDVDTNNEDCQSSEKKLCGGSSSDKDDCLFCDEKIHTLVDCSAVDYSDVHKEKRQLGKRFALN